MVFTLEQTKVVSNLLIWGAVAVGFFAMGMYA